MAVLTLDISHAHKAGRSRSASQQLSCYPRFYSQLHPQLERALLAYGDAMSSKC